MARVLKWSHSFTCTSRIHPLTEWSNHTCLCLPSRSWSSFTDPWGMEGWVGLGGWLHTEINVPHRELNPDTATHPSTNRARRRLTSLIEINALPLRHSTTMRYVFVDRNRPVMWCDVMWCDRPVTGSWVTRFADSRQWSTCVLSLTMSVNNVLQR